MTNIPKKIHIVWIGDDSKRPDEYISSWSNLNAQWRVKVWGNKELAETKWINQAHIDELYKREQYHAVADMMRYEILYNEGGVCVDADLQCVKPLDDHLFKNQIVFCYENEETRDDMIAVTFMASVPKRDFFLELINEIKEDATTPDDWPFKKTGPIRLTEAVKKYALDHVTIHPSHYFIPDHFDAPPYKGDGPVFSRHYWGTTRNSYGRLGKKLKICIYAISKNEEQFVDRWAASGKDADLLLVADTGSTDKTVERCKLAGIQTHEICITPWRFDHARNAAIALIPKDIDVCVSLDMDEVMEPGWREEIERVWVPGTTRLQYYFDWGCGVKFNYQKIHARHGYFWHHPCHEYPVPDGRINEVYAYTEALLVSHHPDPTKSRGQYLDLLALSVKEDPICPRNAFYYARELSFYGRFDESIEECKRYLALPGATWINERSYAMRTIAKCYEGKSIWWEAEAWWLRSAAEAPNTREPWCGLSTLYYMQSRWQDCYGAAMRALGIKDREYVYTVDPAVWGSQPHDLTAIAAWNLGMKDIAAEQGALAVELDPSNERLKENLLWFRGEKGD